MKTILLALGLVCGAVYSAETQLPADTRFDVITVAKGITIKLDKNTGSTWLQSVYDDHFHPPVIKWLVLGTGDGGTNPHWKIVSGAAGAQLINADTGDSWDLKAIGNAPQKVLRWMPSK